jgi:hypothetical protein
MYLCLAKSIDRCCTLMDASISLAHTLTTYHFTFSAIHPLHNYHGRRADRTKDLPMSHIMHKPVCAPTWLLQAQLAPCELVSLLQRPLGWRSKRHPRRCGLSTVQQPASLQCGSTASVYWSTDRRAAPDCTCAARRPSIAPHELHQQSHYYRSSDYSLCRWHQATATSIETAAENPTTIGVV